MYDPNKVHLVYEQVAPNLFTAWLRNFGTKFEAITPLWYLVVHV